MKKDTERKTTVFVDADACPVKKEILLLARRYNVDPVFVSSYNHYSTFAEAQVIYVDTEKEVVDLYILNHAAKRDIVVTEDMGLASMLLSRGVYVLSPRGKVYTEEGISHILEIRHLYAKQRRQGIYAKGPKRFTREDRRTFVSSFEKILSKLAGK